MKTHTNITPGNEVLVAAHAVLNRQLGEAADRVQLELIPVGDGHDGYETECTDGVLTVRGSSAVAICRGFHDYLRRQGLGMVGWEGPRVRLPDTWPDAPVTRVETPFEIRHCYNVTTFGYTFPYWTWERWEQELDWLALHGFNMIMAPVATEAIATRVWRKMGLTQEEIDPFYTGPAHLPWQRMGNLQNLDGTLSAEWHTDQIAMQHKILARMRKLGIEPIVQGFAGFVPDATARIHPELHLYRSSWNGHFTSVSVMMPDQPLFKEISVAYIREWRREFGEARYILVDSFNEMRLPETSRPVTELLADYGKHTFEAIVAGDPNAIWVLQGWMFTYQRSIWNEDTVEALLSAVPDDRMLILDYANDYASNWDQFNGFHGKPWAMGYIPNMGGKTAYTGKMQDYAAGVADMLKHPLGSGGIGFTISPEGIENNTVIYELLSDAAWSRTPIDLDAWVERYCRARYGNGYPEGMRKAWELYRQTCYGTFTDHPRFGWQYMRPRKGTVNSDPRFTEGVLSFLACRHHYMDSASYRDDVVEMAAIALGLRAEDWFVVAKQFYDAGDMAGMDRAASRGLQLLLDADRLLESHSLNRLERWTGLARQHGSSESQKNEYEHNARQIVTTWGPPVNDYAARMWSGLIRDFYQPRMATYFESLKGEPFDRHAWEYAWVHSTGISAIAPFDDPVGAAAELIAKLFAEEIPAAPELKEGVAWGEWTPNLVGTDWKPIEWPLTLEELRAFRGVRFLYARGDHGLEIESVALIADGLQVAIETHPGVAGDQHEGNVYRLEAPANVTANNGAQLQAIVRTHGGTDSYGKVELVTG